MMPPSCNPSTKRWRQADPKCKVTLGSIVSYRPAWATQRPCFKKKNPIQITNNFRIMKAKNWSQVYCVFQGEARGTHGTRLGKAFCTPFLPLALCPHWLSSSSVSLSTFSLHHTTVNCLWMCTALPTGQPLLWMRSHLFIIVTSGFRTQKLPAIPIC